jgi:penicillin-binding protein 1A
MDKNRNNKGNRSEKLSAIKGFFKQNLTERKKEPNFLLSVFVTTIKLFVVSLLILGFAGFGALLGVAKAYVDGTPTLDVRHIEDQNLTSFIYDKNGDLITEYKGLEYRVWATLDEIPKLLQDAVIATEDVRFYAHNGLDYKRLAGAFINNLQSESVQGGSTITQQLIKLTILSPEQTYKRKIQEAYLALQLEKQYEKEEILEAYLNTIYLGSGNYGVKAAAMDYYGKELKDLTLREIAVIVGAIPNGYYYDPRLNIYKRDKAYLTFRRANLVLKLMYENGFISKQDYQNAVFDEEGDETVNAGFHLLEESNHQKLYDYPYFVEYVVEDVITALMEQNGWQGDEGRKKANDLILNGGLHIYTTMDPEIQKSVEDTLYNFEGYPRTANPNDSVIRQSQGNGVLEISQPQAAAVVIDHTTGELRAVVGGRVDPQGRFWQNRAKLPWAPGSSIKPLSVYAPFIEAGYPGGLILDDIPVPIEGWDDGGKKGYPSNYSTSKFYGPTPARKAVTSSYNVSAARTVLERVGTEYAMNKLKELGITDSRYVETSLPSNLSLGSDPVNMIEMTAAFGALANKGVYQEPVSFTKVLDKDGKEILNNTSQLKLSVFKESTAFIMTKWLEDAVDYGTGTRANIKGMNVAGKTGTNNDHRGVFFAGYTPYYTASVVIAPDRHSISLAGGTTGGTHAAPLWKSFMEKIHQDLEEIPFYSDIPEGVKSVKVCALSGKLPTSACDKTVTEYFPENAVPTEECDMHQKLTICKYSGKLPTPFCPEDHMAESSIVVIPEDSIYQRLTDEQLQTYVPGAFRTPVDQASFDYYNPEQRDAFCPVHGEQWKYGEQLRESLTNEANQLISQIRDNMDRYSDKLTQQDVDTLENAISKVTEALNAGVIPPPEEGEPYYTEIPYFEPDKVQREIDSLRETYDQIFDRINSFDFWDFFNGGNRGNNGNNGDNGNNDDNSDQDNNSRHGRGRNNN